MNNSVIIFITTFFSNIPSKFGDFMFLIALMVIIYIIYLIVKLHYGRRDIILNWSDNRCNLSIIPIAGFIKPIGKDKHVGLKGTAENFKFCIDSMSSSIMKLILEPFIIISNLLMEEFENIYDLINNLTDRLSGLKSSLMNMLKTLLEKLSIISKLFGYINIKLDSIKEKTLTIIDNIILFSSAIIDWVGDNVSFMIGDTFEKISLLIDALEWMLLAKIIKVVLNFSQASISTLLTGILAPLSWFFPVLPIEVLSGWKTAGNFISTVGSVGKVAGYLGTELLVSELLSDLYIDSDMLEIIGREMKGKNGEEDRWGHICFTNINIKLNNDEIIQIMNIQPGDRLYNNILVKGIIHTHINDYIYIYTYNGIEVTGSHMILHEKTWMRMTDVYQKYKDDKENMDCTRVRKFVDVLYCLITDTNTIEFGSDMIFRDYRETNDKLLLSYINYYISREANKDKINNVIAGPVLKEYLNHTYLNCLDKSVYDKIIGNKGLKIIGHIKILNTSDIKMFNYKGYILGGNILVYEEGTWIRVWNSKKSILDTTSNKYLYHILTNDNEITIDDKLSIIIKDFNESNNQIINNKIDEMIINNINNNYSND